MNSFPVIVISHIQDCELGSYFRGECDWRHCKSANMETGIFNSLEDIANHIVKLDRQFFDEVQRTNFYSEFEEKIARNITKEHDPKFEYSHLIISKNSFSDDNFGISGENGTINTPTDWEYTDELLKLVVQKKKTATANRLANEEKQKIEKEQKQKQQEQQEQERMRLLNEEHDKQEYARLKEKYENK
jgi:hypothetical protein